MLSLKRWATSRDIPHFDSSGNLTAILGRQPFDYLFSIFNVHVLRAEHLELPRKMTINFHDGPLPKYAGLYATSWALLNREPQHGITWHIVTERIDAGDILLQKFVPVSGSDTAFSLNLKCYEAAIDSFAELLTQLEAGTWRPRPQDLSARSYFPRSSRPVPSGLLPFSQPASRIDALARAYSWSSPQSFRYAQN